VGRMVARWSSTLCRRSQTGSRAYGLASANEIGVPRRSIGTVSRAVGMTSVAQAAGLNREHLYRALNAGGNPELDTVVKVRSALGVQLAAKPKEKVAA